MPLVRISYLENKSPDFGKKVGEIVFKVMMETINVTPKDNLKKNTRHSKDVLIFDPSYLNIQRSDGFILIHITLNTGRSTDAKKTFYKVLAERLHNELKIRIEDVFIGLVEVSKENWSFGNGIAQYAT